MNLDDSLYDKIASNGPFEDMAELSQAIKFVLRRGRNWEAMPPDSKEALELMSSRFAMILCGDPSEAKHWHSIASYARMRSKALEDTLASGVASYARMRSKARAVEPEDGAA